ncbi:uncharacterized protein [Panulirus ornatus]|uniref:uncharacterized protein n=1 Tax=Panulirus ornatus TaxID=150431 RepID=UPI003A871529
MKSSWLYGAAGVTGLLLAVCAFTTPTTAYVTSFPEEPDIDGMLITVGIAVAKFLAGLVPYPTVSALLLAIINAWEPKPQDNYWEHVKDNVAQVCGNFINEFNLRQVEVYKKDLVPLLKKYERADVVSDGTYPDMNTVADAITTSIITNRFLVEAGDMPWSMAVDYTDIAGAHILVLEDVAKIYSQGSSNISRWWVDLSRELQHYIEYGIWLQEVTQKWRNTQIECYFDKADDACLAFEWMGVTCYDKYIITDHVSGYTESCLQLHPHDGEVGSCASFCNVYEKQVNRQASRWIFDNVGSVVREWEALKLKADSMAEVASRYYNPITKDQ